MVYKDVYDADEVRSAELGSSTAASHSVYFQPKCNSAVMLRLELLRRYSELGDRHIQNMGSGAMDDPENFITLTVLAHAKFDHY